MNEQVTTKPVLINLSNHPSSKWSDKQKEMWEKIIDIQFPEIPPDIDTTELYQKYIYDYSLKLADIANEIGGNEFYIMLQGEYTFCYLLYDILKHNLNDDVWHFVVPTTKRNVIETVLEDGKVEKKVVFEFERWRII